MRVFAAIPWARRLSMLVLALSAFGWVAGADAGERHRPRDHHRHAHKREHHFPAHHVHVHHHGKHSKPRVVHRPGWHYHAGRYWAPPSYRGRRCTDHRHYHGVHYHVTVHDYYTYYYPRYRYHGSLPSSPHASLIITVPLF